MGVTFRIAEHKRFWAQIITMQYNKKIGEQLTKNDNLTFFHPKSNPISWHCPNRLKIFDLEYGRKKYPIFN
jgi:hypothetical protein